jgi:hypothetical protein
MFGHLRPRCRVRLHRMLRAAGGRLRLRHHHARGHRTGPQLPVALPRTAAGASHRRRRTQPGAGLDPAAQGRQPRRRTRYAQPVGQGRLGQSHALVQGQSGGRRTVGCAGPGPDNTGVRLHRQPGPRSGCRGRLWGPGLGSGHPPRPGGGQDHHHRDLRRNPAGGGRELRRRQPAVLGDHRRGLLANVGIRERQHPAVLRRGLQVGGLRDRRAARSTRPGARWPISA